MSACAGVSQADYIPRADGVCQRAGGPRLADRRALPSARELRAAALRTDRMVAALRRLEVPKGDEDLLGRYLYGLTTGARRAGRVARAVEQRRPDAARRFAALQKGSGATAALAQRYGFTVCRGSL